MYRQSTSHETCSRRLIVLDFANGDPCLFLLEASRGCYSDDDQVACSLQNAHVLVVDSG